MKRVFCDCANAAVSYCDLISLEACHFIP